MENIQNQFSKKKLSKEAKLIAKLLTIFIGVLHREPDHNQPVILQPPRHSQYQQLFLVFLPAPQEQPLGFF